ncbi:MAG: hypothetical protein LR008_00555 [Candidatus Pacebacteria bacterium]|nr:hypothetical protein [Candidatus Paceibacterota bacterium]
MLSFTGFWLPCTIIGVSIAVDVLLATIVQFHNLNLSLKSWVIPITLTHAVFPIVGYFIFWQAGQDASELIIFSLGFIGFVFVSLLIYEIFCEHIDSKPKLSISHLLSHLIEYVCGLLGYKVDFDSHNAKGLVRVLAVSWDALWIGPAIASNAKVGDWSNLEVLLSFLVFAFIVALVAYATFGFATWLREIKFHNEVKLARYLCFGIIAELSVIGGFGVLSLASGLHIDINLYESIVWSALIIIFISMIYRNDIYDNSIIEARSAINS